MILPLPAFIYTPPAPTEEGRERQDRRMTRDMGIMALVTCILVGMVMWHLSGPAFAIAALGAVIGVSAIGAVIMTCWDISASSVVLTAMALVLAGFAGLAWLAL